MAGEVYRVALDLDRLVDAVEQALDYPGDLFFFGMSVNNTANSSPAKRDTDRRDTPSDLRTIELSR